MPPDLESAPGRHHDAAGWALGALDHDDAQAFREHLPDCAQCEQVITDFQRVAGALRRTSPELELPPDLEERTITAVLQAAASQSPGEASQSPGEASQAAAAASQAPGEASQAPGDASQAPGDASQAPGDASHPHRQQAPGKIIRWPLGDWRTRLVAAGTAVAAAAVIAAAVIVPQSLRGAAPSGPVAAEFSLHSVTATTTAAGQATVYQEPAGFKIVLQLHGLPPTHPGQYYGCWYMGPQNSRSQPELITAGSFTVGRSGTADLTMWSAASPAKLPTMEITIDTATATAPGKQVLVGRAAL